MEADRVKALVQVSALRFQADQARLAQLQAKERDLRQNLQDLVQQRNARAVLATGADDPATIAGADVQWHAWVDQRRKTINAELAQLLAQKADYQARVQRSFGQDQAAQALLQKVQVAQRRSTYES
jgi:enoyl-CoA hydratase/carnithine racemase